MGAVTGLDSVKAQRVMMGSIYYLIFPDQASIEELTRGNRDKWDLELFYGYRS